MAGCDIRHTCGGMWGVAVGVVAHGDDMTGQLELIGGRQTWQLDESTREAGRRGVERARAALIAARRHLDPDESRPEADQAA